MSFPSAFDFMFGPANTHKAGACTCGLSGCLASMVSEAMPWTIDQEYKPAYFAWLDARVSDSNMTGMFMYHVEKSSDDTIYGAFAAIGKALSPMFLTGPIEKLVLQKKYALVVRIVQLLATTFRAHKYFTEVVFVGLVKDGFTAGQLAELHATAGFKITQKLLDSAFQTSTVAQIEAIISTIATDSKVAIHKGNITTAIKREDASLVTWIVERSDAIVTDVDLAAMYFTSLAKGSDEKIKQIIHYLVLKTRYRPSSSVVAKMIPGQRALFDQIFGYQFDITPVAPSE